MDFEGLIDPTAHEPVTGGPWSERVARDAIAAIVADAEGAFDERNLWPAHRRDGATPEEASGELPGLASLYFGAAGVIWALHELQRRGSAELMHDYAPVAAELPERHRAAPDFPDAADERGPAPSLWMGEAGVRLVAQLVAPSSGNADALHGAILRNADNPALELMWGATGTMVAAATMHELTAETRWRDAWQRSADALWAVWDDELWEQQLRGRRLHSLGPAHGSAGTIAVLSGSELLDADRGEELERRAITAYARLARRGRDRRDGTPVAQWPASTESMTPRRGGIRLQWCHGSPGIVASLAHLAPNDDGFTELLVAGGELIWRAGPTRRGPGLCHGAAGSGYAMLKLAHRSGEERWLGRARAFAMHAIAEIVRRREHDGRGHYTLWTGDLGAAVFLQDCIDADADARIPTLDRF
jgi:Lanthionine synthetase C-like protein